MIKGGYIHSIGRRKTSVARAYLKTGSGNLTVNSKPYDQYFDRETLRMVVVQPLEKIDQLKNFDIKINVCGGGKSGQAGAVRHAIARALIQFDETLRGALKVEGYLTRDSRAVERKKYGRHKARKRPQYSKR